jgi:hypothetical protein
MKPFLDYGPATGPLGFPMTDRAARALEALLKALPRGKEYEYRKAVVARAPTELNPGERSDVSWISTEVVDRQSEVVRARGLNDSQFQLNPLVTLQHAYFLPPVGKSLWRKYLKDGELKGIKAKTVYPARPESWEDSPWPPDQVFALVQAGMMTGKSIGFLPTRVHAPTDREIEQNGWQGCALVIDEWLLLEYACCFLPVNQNALVEAVSKGTVELPDDFARALGIDTALFRQPPEQKQAPAGLVRHTPVDEIARAVQRRIEGLDLAALVQTYIDKARGRV